jgi:hypothetical protein
MKKPVIFGSAVVVLAMASALCYGAVTSSRAANQLFMRQKLAWSQAALEGITLEKFDVVSKNAIRMKDMTVSNAWFKMKTPQYMQHTTNFYKNVDALYMAAVDKNLDAATEAYVKVAKNCVECHRMVRLEQRKAALSTGETAKP